LTIHRAAYVEVDLDCASRLLHVALPHDLRQERVPQLAQEPATVARVQHREGKLARPDLAYACARVGHNALLERTPGLAAPSQKAKQPPAKSEFIFEQTLSS